MTKGTGVVRFDLTSDPIAAAEALRDAVDGIQSGLRARLADAFALAVIFCDNEKEWARFCAHSFWNGKPPNEYLRGVMRFIHNAPTTYGRNYNCAVRHTTALQPFFDERKSVEEARASIEKSGPEALYEAAVAAKKKPAAEEGNTEPEPSEESMLDGREITDYNLDDSDTLGKQKRGSIISKVSARPPKVHTQNEASKPAPINKYSRAWCENRFCVDVALEALLLKCLDLKDGGAIDMVLPDGTEAEIVFTHQDADGWGHFLMRERKAPRAD